MNGSKFSPFFVVSLVSALLTYPSSINLLPKHFLLAKFLKV